MNITEAHLERLIVHYTGNKQNGEALLLSRQEPALDPESRQRFTENLLDRFKECHERYSFHHSSSLDYHEVYNFVAALFRKGGAAAGRGEGDQGTGGEGATGHFPEQTGRKGPPPYRGCLPPKLKPAALSGTFFYHLQ